jgi:hypothetical protein
VVQRDPYSDRELGGPGLNRSVPIGDQAVGAEWSWTGVHDDQRLAGSFNGITASGREVTARGFTLMGVEDELFNGAALRRLGGSLRPARLTLNWRTPTAVDVSLERDRGR